MNDYYGRSVQTFLDGTPIFKTAEDEAAEQQVATILAQTWGCDLRPFGCLSPIDWYGVRDGRVVGVLELKHRSHPTTKYPTVFLNVRKWLALNLAGSGLGVPAIFVVQFSDCIKWISLADIRPSRVIVGGCKGIVKSRNDIEPVIEISVAEMKLIRSGSDDE